MAKTLITFLGTGKQELRAKRQYREAKYKFDNNETYETPFIAAALSKYHQVDRIIMIGTTGSIWEVVYEYFSNTHNINIDETKYAEIGDYCEKANHKTALDIPHKKDIEAVMGAGSHIVLVKYGVNESEVKENTNIIAHIDSYIEQGDELIVDITHSFRSLPLFIMNLLIYLKNVSKRDINISHIYYGMLDISGEMKYTPVVDLKSILEVNDWITGAYAFEQFGNAYKISELMEEEDNGVATNLKRFSDLLNLNHLAGIESEVHNLEAMAKKEYSPLPNMIIRPIADKFAEKFSKAKRHSLFQLRLAKWQYEHYNFSSAYITLQEALITYVCEQNKRDPLEKQMREEVKKSLIGRGKDKFVSEIATAYKSINEIRNSLAHSIKTEKRYTEMINTLKEQLAIVENIIK